ncbi:MAG: hypothetical protein K6A42_06860 [Treponema sp.]|nr:hypothetical protein [Treponema sp.]
MIGFYLKKNFCDGWDNILFLIVPNIITTLYAALAFFLLGNVFKLETSFALPLSCMAFVALFALGMVLVMASSENAKAIANFQMPSLAEYFKQIPHVFLDAIRYGALLGILIVVAFIGIPVYLSAGGILGVALCLTLIFFEAILFFSLQWFIPLRALLGHSFGKTIKKCFVIFFDNTGFSVFIFFWNLFLGVLSFLIFCLVPGTAGIVLSGINALRLRLYKYDWLDAHPENKSPKLRKKIPWAALIKEDDENLGPRNFKSFFMPWKN